MNAVLGRARDHLCYAAKVLNTFRYQIRNAVIARRHSPRTATSHKTVSVIIPTLSQGRQADHLPKLKQLLSEYLPDQTHTHYEALVFCDGPNPMVETMVLSLKDGRVKVYATDQTLGKWGHPQTRMGILAATGSFFVRMNDDNKPYKTYLQTLMDGFDPEVGIVYGRVVYKGEDARRAHKNSLVHSFVIPGDKQGVLKLRNIDCMNFMVKMDLAKKYAEEWRDIYAADWGFLEALLKNGVKARFRDVIIGEKF